MLYRRKIDRLAHVHPISDLAADRTDSREGSLKWRRLKLGISPPLKSTAICRRRILCFKLPTDSSYSLFLCSGKWEDLPAHKAKRTVIIIENPLVTVLVTDVGEPC